MNLFNIKEVKNLADKENIKPLDLAYSILEVREPMKDCDSKSLRPFNPQIIYLLVLAKTERKAFYTRSQIKFWRL
ncbi:MAG: hypothetical protein V1770_04580 [bacterium]